MKPIERARAELNASKTSGENDAFIREMEVVLETGMKLKKRMIERSLTKARAVCPNCKNETLRGRLVVGSAAGRHRNSGGAFRMWCDSCPSMRMME